MNRERCLKLYLSYYLVFTSFECFYYEERIGKKHKILVGHYLDELFFAFLSFICLFKNCCLLMVLSSSSSIFFLYERWLLWWVLVSTVNWFSSHEVDGVRKEKERLTAVSSSMDMAYLSRNLHRWHAFLMLKSWWKWSRYPKKQASEETMIVSSREHWYNSHKRRRA